METKKIIISTSRDSRYGIIKALIQSGHVRSFREIFNYIPKTVVYRDLGVNFNRFSRAILDPSKFTLGELRTLAEFFEIDTKQMIDMTYAQPLMARSRSKGKIAINNHK